MRLLAGSLHGAGTGLASFIMALGIAVLAGCSSMTPAPAPVSSAPAAVSSSPPASAASTPRRSSTPALPPAGSGRGGYYLDDGPADVIPEGLAELPDAEPRIEPFLRSATNRPYVVFGKTYSPFTDMRAFRQRGIGSWYGKKFHGQKTSSGEPYDMFKMTAAHPTLPIPSYVRVTRLATGKQIIVRINDRGPFHSDRIIDLSYTAALKLGYLGRGSGEIELERLLPEEIARINSQKSAPASPSAASVELASIGPQSVSVVSVSAPAQQPPGLAASGSFYLQLGAYSQSANAEQARDRLSRLSGVRLPSVEVVRTNDLYRLFGGPFSNRSDAEAAAQAIRSAGSGSAVIVQR